MINNYENKDIINLYRNQQTIVTITWKVKKHSGDVKEHFKTALYNMENNLSFFN